MTTDPTPDGWCSAHREALLGVSLLDAIQAARNAGFGVEVRSPHFRQPWTVASPSARSGVRFEGDAANRVADVRPAAA